MADSRVGDYKELIAWKRAMELAKIACFLSKLLPKEENYALTGQMRRAAISIPSNIAEGAGRYNTKDYVHFLRIARGSNNELETQLSIREQVGYFSKEELIDCYQLCDEITRMLNALLLKLKTT